jgi:hypothetical protein
MNDADLSSAVPAANPPFHITIDHPFAQSTSLRSFAALSGRPTLECCSCSTPERAPPVFPACHAWPHGRYPRASFLATEETSCVPQLLDSRAFLRATAGAVVTLLHRLFAKRDCVMSRCQPWAVMRVSGEDWIGCQTAALCLTRKGAGGQRVPLAKMNRTDLTVGEIIRAFFEGKCRAGVRDRSAWM